MNSAPSWQVFLEWHPRIQELLGAACDGERRRGLFAATVIAEPALKRNLDILQLSLALLGVLQPNPRYVSASLALDGVACDSSVGSTDYFEHPLELGEWDTYAGLLTHFSNPVGLPKNRRSDSSKAQASNQSFSAGSALLAIAPGMSLDVRKPSGDLIVWALSGPSHGLSTMPPNGWLQTIVDKPG